MSSRNLMSGRTLFPVPSEPEPQAEPSKLERENVSSPQATNIVKPEMEVGDYVCVHCIALWRSFLVVDISCTAQKVF